jgi:hypothetical protein
MDTQPQKRDWFYWFIAGIVVSQVPFTALMIWDFILHPLAPYFSSESSLFRIFATAVMGPVMLFIAQLVIRRAPYNVTGLALLLWAMSVITTSGREETLALQGLSISWIGIWLLPIFFPNGRVFPPRLEPYIRVVYFIFILNAIPMTLSLRQFPDYLASVPNPLFVPGLERLHPVSSTIDLICLILIIGMVLPSQIARYVKSNQHVRQQLKWLAWVFVVILFTFVLLALIGINSSDPRTLNPVERFIGDLTGILVSVGPFSAVSIAILRYRLYDIDVIIRRTLIYSMITGVLALVYFGGVALMQSAFVAITGQESPLAVVASTLAIAALFTPVRRRVQDVVDRRFFRRKYDAQKTVDQFARAVRDEVDVDRLRGELVRVVETTMQPASVSLWLREK